MVLTEMFFFWRWLLGLWHWLDLWLLSLWLGRD
jgi:hypothetical protein